MTINFFTNSDSSKKQKIEKIDNNTNGRLYELFGTAYMMNTYYLCSRKKQNDHHYEKNTVSTLNKKVQIRKIKTIFLIIVIE